MSEDLYSILGVSKNASEDELKRQYHKAALKYHPDRQQGKSEAEKKEAEKKFKTITEAYEVLSDKEKRQYYDQFGTVPGQQGGGNGQSVDPREFFRRHFHGFNPFGGFGDFNPFGDFDNDSNFNSRNYNPNAPENGSDIKIKVNIPLEDILYGSTKEFDIGVNDPCEQCKGTGAKDGKMNNCPHCGGSGMLTQRHGMMIMQSTCPHCHGSGRTNAEPCPHCHGSGNVSAKRHVKIDIPQGIADGQCLSIKGSGVKGVRGGNNGDLYIFTQTQGHDIFTRDGLNLHTNLIISPITAIIGGNVEVQTPWGIAKLKIPAGTQNGKVLRISGKGIKSTSGIGDLFVNVAIEIPTSISKDTIEKLSEINNTLNVECYKDMKILSQKCKDFENRTKNRR